MAQRDTKNILVLDDEEAHARLIERTLTRSIVGLSVVTKAHAQGAIEAFQEAEETDKPFDLVIADVNLGAGMDGADAVRYMLEHRERFGHKMIRLKVIIMSARRENEAMVRNKMEGGFPMDHFLLKPFAVTSFRNEVLEVLTK